MKMTDFKRLLPRIYAHAPGVPETMAFEYLRDATITFCERTGCLEREEVVHLQCGERQYPLTVPDCERIVRITQVALNGRELTGIRDTTTIRTDHCHHGRDVYWVDAVESSYPTLNIDTHHNEECYVAVVRWQATPKIDACEIDSRVADEWGRGLVYGALSEILMIPNQTWTSIDRARVYEKRYLAEVSRARARRYTGRTGGQTTFAPIPLGV